MPIPTRTDTTLLPTPSTDRIVVELLPLKGRPLPTKGMAHYDTANFPNHKVTHVKPADDNRGYEVYYAADRSGQDNYNFESSVPGISGPEYPTVQRTYIISRSAFNPTSPAMGTAMPRDPSNKFSTGYVLAARQQQRADEVLDGLYVVEQRTYVKKTSLVGMVFDDFTGKHLQTTQTHYFRGETIGGVPIEDLVADPTNAYWGLQADGTIREARPVSADWWLVESRAVIAGVFSAGTLTVRSFSTNIDYYWPPVLSTIDVRQWELLNGSYEQYPDVTFDPEGYRGPCKAQVTVTWAPTAFTIPQVQQMLPTSLYYASPYFDLNIPACLHDAGEVKCNIGSGDDRYAENANSEKTIEATTLSDGTPCLTWPSSIIAQDEQQPFRGGYLRTRIEVFKPGTT